MGAARNGLQAKNSVKNYVSAVNRTSSPSLSNGRFRPRGHGGRCFLVSETLAEVYKTRQHNVSNWLWSDVYWKRLSDKICFSFTNVDVIYVYFLNFAWKHKTIINLINVLPWVSIWQDSERISNATKHLSPWQSGLMHPVGRRGEG